MRAEDNTGVIDDQKTEQNPDGPIGHLEEYQGDKYRDEDKEYLGYDLWGTPEDGQIANNY
jgi:hypothetical protein